MATEKRNTTTALIHRDYGTPEEVLALEEVELGTLGSREVEVELMAAAVHPSDLGMIGGSYGRLRELPAVAGREAVGRIVAVGSDLSRDGIGRMVRIPEDHGVWQERFHLPFENLQNVPDSVDPQQAALAAVNPPTAYRLLHDFVSLQKGDWIIQNAGNSAVGIAVSQLAREMGFRTVSLVRRKELIEPLKSMGADIVLTDDREASKRIVEEATGGRRLLGLNSIGGTSVLSVLQSMEQGGVVVTFGAMTGDKIRFPTRQLIFDDLTLRGFWMDRWNRTHTMQEKTQLMKEVYHRLLVGVLQTPIAGTYPLSKYKEAFGLQSEARLGKVLFVPDESNSRS